MNGNLYVCKFKKIKKAVAVCLALLMMVSAIMVGAISCTAAETTYTVTDSGFIKAGFVPVSAENKSEGNPFARGTANGSTTFRIPGLITLANGDLLAVADARNGGVADHGGHDTVASVSSDGGATWYWSVPLKFPDSASFSAYGTSNTQTDATTLVDPLAVQGADGTVYCTTNVVPGGISAYAGNVGAGSGFVAVGGKKHLAVTDDYATKAFTQPTDDDLETYPYYVGDFLNGCAEILKRADGSSTGYGVDAYFNLYYVENGVFSATVEGKADLTQPQVDSETLIQQNIFYKASKFHVYNTSYTFIITSSDNGRSWNAPEIVDIKRSAAENYGQEEKVVLLSPGRGLCTSSGDIIMQVYNQNGRYKLNASILYSTDNGKSWHRSNDVDGMWSSENEIVELNNGVLRMFFRNGEGVICYADITKQNGAYTVGEGKKTDVVVRSDCRFSAIKTSYKTEQGESVVLTSAPSVPTTRNNGKITAFAVDSNNNMRVLHEFQVNEGWFAYSCLTERADGKIALLWESNTAAFTYSVYDIEALLGNVVVDLSIGEVYSETVLSDALKPITQNADSSIASVTSELKTVNGYVPLYKHASDTANSLSSFSTEFDLDRTLEAAEFTLKASGSGWTVYNEHTNTYLTNATNASTFFTAASSVMLVNPTAEGSTTFTIRRSANTRYVVFNPAKMVFDAVQGDTTTSCDYKMTLLEKQDAVSATDTVPGYKAVTEITDGKKYLITHVWSDGSVILLFPTNGTANQTKLVGKPTDIKTNTVTVTGVSNGYTTAVIGGTLYKITVHLDEDETRDNMPPRIEGVSNGEICYGDKSITVEDKYLQSVTVNGEDVTQTTTSADTVTNSYTLDFDTFTHTNTNHTISTSAGRGVLGVTGGTPDARIYWRSINNSPALKWAASTVSGGIILGKEAVGNSGLAHAYELLPNRKFTISFELYHESGNGVTVSAMAVKDYATTSGVVLDSEVLTTANKKVTSYTLEFTVPDSATLGENKYLSIMMTKPASLTNYTVYLDNLTLTETVLGTTTVNTVQNITLTGGADTTYTITATDISGNKTEHTIYMKRTCLEMVRVGSIRTEKHQNGKYVSAGVRYKGRVYEDYRETADELGFVAVPTAVLNGKNVAEYMQQPDNEVVTAKVKSNGMSEIVYAVGTDSDGNKYYDYQFILTGLTREGKTINLLDTELTVAMYSVINGQTVYGETIAYSYNDVAEKMAQQ